MLLGTSPDLAIGAEFWRLKQELNDNPDCHLELSFNVELAHLVYAGADMLVMPSLFEPCGLTQLIALKYGTVPVVRATGGLVDTVFDRDYTHGWERNGYVFHDFEPSAIEVGHVPGDRSVVLIPGPVPRTAAQRDALGSLVGLPGQDYVNIYEYIRHK